MSTLQGGSSEGTAAYDEAWDEAITLPPWRLRWRRWRLSRQPGDDARARRLATESVMYTRGMR